MGNEFREPSRLSAVREDGEGLHRRPAQTGASSDSEARHEDRTPSPPIALSIRPSGDRRRSRRPAEAYKVEVVRFRDLPPNRENPHSALSPADRYECLMICLAEVWSDVCKRPQADSTKPMERRAVA